MKAKTASVAQVTTRTPQKRRNSGRPSESQQKKRHVEALAPGVKSPERLANGLYCKGCDHDKLSAFIPYERSHFTVKLCALKNYPKDCSGCNRSLLPGKDKEKFVQIRGIFNVKCCSNAINHRDHECVYALCHECFDMKKEERNSPAKKRGMKRSRFFLPGEICLGNGSIGVAP